MAPHGCGQTELGCTTGLPVEELGPVQLWQVESESGTREVHLCIDRITRVSRGYPGTTRWQYYNPRLRKLDPLEIKSYVRCCSRGSSTISTGALSSPAWTAQTVALPVPIAPVPMKLKQLILSSDRSRPYRTYKFCQNLSSGAEPYYPISVDEFSSTRNLGVGASARYQRARERGRPQAGGRCRRGCRRDEADVAKAGAGEANAGEAGAGVDEVGAGEANAGEAGTGVGEEGAGERGAHRGGGRGRWRGGHGH
ncbi:hypothetical protein B0H16DRAFT_1485612 [Mycena metata]|uniref:Uncharacterized protein n=1 Tax=Mycena metata TaxID=1033252 RepID=A0AAD7DMB7_9AGAR|nr:hypothetical protein B0H16DRAFT_1485612 [Mycena metata]